ncbi:MAG: hypothetical protein ACI4VO_05105 [Clostridia bacterium]
MNKRLRGKNGITLVALVITIALNRCRGGRKLENRKKQEEILEKID